MNAKPYRLTAPVLNENDIEKACLDFLKVRGYWVIRLHAGRFKTLDGQRWVTGVDKGTPDWAALHCRFPAFLLEVKRPGAKPDPHQEFKIFEIKTGYHLAVCVADHPSRLREWLDLHEKVRR